MQQAIFSFHCSAPKYIQIYEQFKGFIEKGHLSSNEQLPSIRVLAEQLHVSRNTTLQAYELLLAEGYIRSEQKKGYFVNDFEPIFISNAEHTLPVLDDPQHSFIDFRVGAIDRLNFPLQKWRQLSNVVLKDENSYTYGEPFGEAVFKHEIAKYLFHARGLSASPHQIIIGSNTQQLLIHLSFILKDTYTSIALENPGYRGAREVFSLQNFKVEPITVTEHGMTMTELEDLNSSVIYVTPSHQYPFGTSMSIQDRLQLIEWASSRDGFIIEDDYDGEYRYAQKTFPALASLNHNKVIYLGTFSKAFLPGIRLAYMVLPQSLVGLYTEKFSQFEHNASLLHQLTMAQFMRLGEWEKHIRRMRKIYSSKMDFLKIQLQKHLGDRCEVIGTKAGLYVLIKIATKDSEEILIEKAKQEKVKVYPVNNLFIQGISTCRYLLLGFANLTIEQMEEGVLRLKKAWN